MTKSLEQWKKDHEAPLYADLVVEVLSWNLGNWRKLTAPELKLRVYWREKCFDIKKWAGFDFDTWVAWIRNGCRPPYYMHAPRAREAEKQRIMEQAEMYARAMGLTVVRPEPRRSDHCHAGVDFSGPHGSTIHLELIPESWADERLWKQEHYGEWKEEVHEEQGTTVDGGNPGHGEPRPD